MSELVYYIICAVLSIAVLIGISLMSKVKTAVAGNLLSAVSLFLGVVVTLHYNQVFSAWSIYAFMLIGVLIGGNLASRVKMIQMPQLVALLNGVGGLASVLVGVLSLLGIGVVPIKYPVFVNVTSVLAIIVGLVTLTGSLVAAGKLHKLISQRPIVWKNHSTVLNFLMFLMIGVTVFAGFMGNIPMATAIAVALIVSIAASSMFGYAFAIRVGGADMPITISLLNSLSGVAGAIAGMAVNDLLLVSVGGIVGASGLFLTQIMCRAMNRSLKDILLGKTSISKSDASKVTSAKAEPAVTASAVSNSAVLNSAEAASNSSEEIIDELGNTEIKIEAGKKVDETDVKVEEPAIVTKSEKEILKSAKSVIVVPGYGMALAQAQHLVRQLTDRLEHNGAEVKFAIHPVAGRMPGHMNVLLAEADVPYEKLYEMDAINDEFADTDVVVVIGANDVINPAARDAKDTPIYGMPVLNVDKAKEVFICNFDLQPGYAGVDNPLYSRKEGVYMKLGDAKESLNKLLEMMY